MNIENMTRNSLINLKSTLQEKVRHLNMIQGEILLLNNKKEQIKREIMSIVTEQHAIESKSKLIDLDDRNEKMHWQRKLNSLNAWNQKTNAKFESIASNFLQLQDKENQLSSEILQIKCEIPHIERTLDFEKTKQEAEKQGYSSWS